MVGGKKPKYCPGCGKEIIARGEHCSACAIILGNIKHSIKWVTRPYHEQIIELKKRKLRAHEKDRRNYDKTRYMELQQSRMGTVGRIPGRPGRTITMAEK